MRDRIRRLATRPSLARTLVAQLASLLVLLVLASLAIFASMELAPGSAESVLFGQQTVDPAVRAAVRAQYHLDDPFLQRYVAWLSDVVRGDLGMSLAYREPVIERIKDGIGTTLLLVAYAALLIGIAGVGLGSLAALRPGRVDTGVLVATSVAVAVPTFVAAMALLSVFSVELGWFPVFGPGSGFLDRLHHLTLPAVALALWASAYLARVTRSAMREELAREHVETARARGIPERQIVRRHVVRNALIPISTVAGMQVASLLVGTVVVEQIFQLGGIGQLLLSAVNEKDLPVVQAVCLILVTAFVLINGLVDALYRVLDPRLRAEGAR